jgi:hypothetical protein
MKRPRCEHQATTGDNGAVADNTTKERATKRTACCFFDWLPQELVVDILLATKSAQAIAAWAATAKGNLALAGDQTLWRLLCQAVFGATCHSDPKRAGKNWQWAFRARAFDASAASGASAGRIKFQLNGSDALYWGDLADGMPHGVGVCMTLPLGESSGRYEGQFAHGKRQGRGIYASASGERYEGDWDHDKMHGLGVYTFSAGGGRYEGSFADDKLHGRGVYTWSNSERYEGEYAAGQRCGRGVYTWPDGSRYEGEFVDDQQHGLGVHTYPDGHGCPT